MSRAEAIAAARGAAAAARLADRLAAAAPRGRAVRDGARVIVTGRGLLADPAMRWPGGWIA